MSNTKISDAYLSEDQLSDLQAHQLKLANMGLEDYTDPINESDAELVQRSMLGDLQMVYQSMIDAIIDKVPLSKEERENMQGSASRVAKAMCDLVHSKPLMIANLKHILKDDFPTKDSSKFVPHSKPLILSTSPVRTNSVCPHHFLPVQYKVFIAVKIPTNSNTSKVFGLSKYTRAAQQLAKRPVIQEQYTKDLVHLFTDSVIGSEVFIGTGTVAGCMVVVDGSHGCMTCRGVEADSPTITSYSYGMTDLEIQEAWNHYNGSKK